MPDAPYNVQKKTSQNSTQRAGPSGGRMEFCDVFFGFLKSRISRKCVRHNSGSARICGFRTDGVHPSLVRNCLKSGLNCVRRRIVSFLYPKTSSKVGWFLWLESAFLGQNELCPMRPCYVHAHMHVGWISLMVEVDRTNSII